MFREILSGFSVLTAVLGIVMATPAAACTDTANAWDCVHDAASGTWGTNATGKTYTGSFTLSQWYLGSIRCDSVTAEVDLIINVDGSIDVAMTSFHSSASSHSFCVDITYNNLPWTGPLDGTEAPASETDATPAGLTIATFTILYNGTMICQDSLDLSFANDGSGGSQFDFDDSIAGWAGSCSIDGTLFNSHIAAH